MIVLTSSQISIIIQNRWIRDWVLWAFDAYRFDSSIFSFAPKLEVSKFAHKIYPNCCNRYKGERKIQKAMRRFLRVAENELVLEALEHVLGSNKLMVWK